MSAYISLKTPMFEQSCLLAALQDLGFDADKVEVHEEPAALVGYEGNRRGEQAHIVIRRQFVGRASNDIGFLRTPQGFQVMISDYDGGGVYGVPWLNRLYERYQGHYVDLQQRMEEEDRRRLEEERRCLVEAQRQKVLEQAKKLGYRVQETREGNQVKLVLLKRTY